MISWAVFRSISLYLFLQIMQKVFVPVVSCDETACDLKEEERKSVQGAVVMRLVLFESHDETQWVLGDNEKNHEKWYMRLQM